eukprot:TRINITY_DN2851_c0_g1_i1.p1 TRINITY_DN2851_c0_g1~~TRINITY_DN2851_c0_g1_i1.p1  ORF type:complete len:541 (-),score=124.94 TRINITY_DN2851_c0_g1_i1:910-2532(-)
MDEPRGSRKSKRHDKREKERENNNNETGIVQLTPFTHVEQRSFKLDRSHSSGNDIVRDATKKEEQAKERGEEGRHTISERRKKKKPKQNLSSILNTVDSAPLPPDPKKDKTTTKLKKKYKLAKVNEINQDVGERMKSPKGHSHNPIRPTKNHRAIEDDHPLLSPKSPRYTYDERRMREKDRSLRESKDSKRRTARLAKEDNDFEQFATGNSNSNSGHFANNNNKDHSPNDHYFDDAGISPGHPSFYKVRNVMIEIIEESSEDISIRLPILNKTKKNVPSVQYIQKLDDRIEDWIAEAGLSDVRIISMSGYSISLTSAHHQVWKYAKYLIIENTVFDVLFRSKTAEKSGTLSSPMLSDKNLVAELEAEKTKNAGLQKEIDFYKSIIGDAVLRLFQSPENQVLADEIRSRGVAAAETSSQLEALLEQKTHPTSPTPNTTTVHSHSNIEGHHPKFVISTTPTLASDSDGALALNINNHRPVSPGRSRSLTIDVAPSSPLIDGAYGYRTSGAGNRLVRQTDTHFTDYIETKKKTTIRKSTSCAR